MEKNAMESHGKNSTFTFHNWKQKVISKSPIFPVVDGFRLIGLSFRPDAFGVCLVSGSFA